MSWQVVQLGEVISHRKRFIRIDDTQTYKRCRVQIYAKGVVLRDIVEGIQIKTKEQQICRANDFLVAEIDAKVGGFGILPSELDGAIVSSHYFLFEIDETKLLKDYLGYWIRTPGFQDQVTAQGSTNYAAIRQSHVLGYEIPLAPLDEQRRVVENIEAFAARIGEARGLRQGAVEEAEALFLDFSAKVFSTLAENHTYIQLGSVFTFRNNLIRPSDGVSGELTFVGLQHVESNTGKRIGKDYLLAEELKGRKFRFSTGEIVYGYLRPYLNKVWIADCDGFCSVDQYVLRPNPDLVNTFYLAYFMRSRLFLQSAIELTNNLQLPRLRSGLLQAMTMPLPPLNEQGWVVTDLDDLQIQVDLLKRLQAETATELDALLPSVLDRAFKGELIFAAPITLAAAFNLDPRKLVALAILMNTSNIDTGEPKPINITELMKYAFLVQEEGRYQFTERYSFTPYDFGPFDKTMYSDLNSLEKEGLLTQREEPNRQRGVQRLIILASSKRDEIQKLVCQLPDEMQSSIHEIVQRYMHLDQNELLTYVYARYPDYAVNSKRFDLVKKAEQMRRDQGWL